MAPSTLDDPKITPRWSVDNPPHTSPPEDWEVRANEIAIDFGDLSTAPMLEEEIIDLVKRTLLSYEQKIREDERERIGSLGKLQSNLEVLESQKKQVMQNIEKLLFPEE